MIIIVTKKEYIDYLIDSSDDISHSERKRRVPGSLFDILADSTYSASAIRRSNGASGGGFSDGYSYKYWRDNLVSGSQYTRSETHPSFSQNIRKGKLPEGDLGGPFFSQTRVVYAPFGAIRRKLKKELFDGTYDIVWKYDGYVFPTTPSSIPSISDLSLSQRDLKPLGSTAISRCKPTNNVAELAVFLAELYSDGLPKLFGATLWKENVDLARSAGEEYLNTEFGWKPLVSDVRDITHALTHASTVLQQYERNAGGIVRRRYEFPIEETSSPVVSIDNVEAVTQPFATALYDTSKAKGGNRKQTTTWRRTWFSGAFTYHLPSDYRSRNRLVGLGSKAATLLGSDLTPDVLWNAAPWSWAIDWFSNAGDVISNLSDWATDGLVMKYGYIMEHSIVKTRYFWEGNTQLPGNPYPTVIDSMVETKRREAASPFGFDVDWSGLNPRQWAIAAALGLTRR